MPDVNEVRGIEQQQVQGAYNPNLYSDVRMEQQPWQAQANADAQRFVPTFEESSTNSGANKYAPQQHPIMQQDTTRAGADKYAAQQNPVMVQDNSKGNRGQKLDRDRPSQPNPDKLDTTNVKYGTNNKGASDGKVATDKNGATHITSNEKSGDDEPTADLASNQQIEHMDKLPADADKEGEKHMDKLPADAAEDESAGSFGGSGDSSSDSGERTPRDRERERAKEVFESIGGTAAPRVFNSVGEAAIEAIKHLRNQK